MWITSVVSCLMSPSNLWKWLCCGFFVCLFEFPISLWLLYTLFDNLHPSSIRYLSVVSVMSSSQENLAFLYRLEEFFRPTLMWTNVVILYQIELVDSKDVAACYIQVYLSKNFLLISKWHIGTPTVWEPFSASLDTKRAFVHSKKYISVLKMLFLRTPQVIFAAFSTVCQYASDKLP